MKDLIEINVFKTFAKIYPIPLLINSVIKNKEPEADINCKTQSGETKSFELVEIIDSSIASVFSNESKLKNHFYLFFENMGVAEKKEFNKKFKNAAIFIDFYKNISLHKKLLIIPKILKNLLILNKDDVGKYKGNSFPDINKFIKWVFITRGVKGPIFDINTITSFSDPIFDEIKKKFNKTYNSLYDIELLAYYNVQPCNKFNEHISKAKDFIVKNLKKSPFSKVWFFSVQENKVIFSYPIS